MAGKRVLRKTTVEKTQIAKEKNKIPQKRKRKVSTPEEITAPEKKLKIENDLLEEKKIPNYFHAKFRRTFSPKISVKDKQNLKTSTTPNDSVLSVRPDDIKGISVLSKPIKNESAKPEDGIEIPGHSKQNKNASVKPEDGKELSGHSKPNDVSVNPENVNVISVHSNTRMNSENDSLITVISSPDVIIYTSRDAERSPSVVFLTPKDTDKDLEIISVKRHSMSKTPSPLVIGGTTSCNFVGVSALHNIINDEDFLEFLEVLERSAAVDSENYTMESGPCIQRIEQTPELETNLSNFFECPLCCKVFTDKIEARMHLENYCSKLN